MSMESDLKQMARLAGDAADMAACGQKAVMGLLLAEMKALAAMMPGSPVVGETAREAEARARAVEAEVEASFDNMPV